MHTSFLLAFILFASEVLTNSVKLPCHVGDKLCMENFFNDVHSTVILGIPELGIESSEPLFIKEIEGNLPTLKYNFFDNTLTGFSNCSISNVKMNEDITNVKYELNCGKLTLRGKYEMKGHLISLPVEGKGDYESIAEKYLVHVTSHLNEVKGTDGVTHLSIDKNELKCVPLDVITYNFENLFDGQKDLADAVHKFAAEHWRQVAELVQDPIWYALVNKINANIDTYLYSVPLEDIIRN